MRGGRGFTLTELAVVMAIVALLLGGLMYTLGAQTEQRNFEETRQRLEAMREMLLSYAIVNGRLPCPAVCTDATCSAGGVEAPAGGGTCTNYYSGYFPARTVGYQNVDSNGYALDAWGNRIRYAVSNTTWSSGAGMFTKQHATTSWSVGTSPADLVICSTSTGINATSCNTATPVTNTGVVVAIIFSTGKNGSIACPSGMTCPDETANTNSDQVFVYHSPTPDRSDTGAVSEEFDDQFTWLTVGELYSKMISAGVLP